MQIDVTNFLWKIVYCEKWKTLYAAIMVYYPPRIVIIVFLFA